MIKKVLKTSATTGLILVLFSGSVLAVTGKVTGTNVRIRESASSKSLEVSVATKNETVNVIGEEGDWYHVVFENVTGYISKDYVNTDYSSESSTITEETVSEPEQEISEPEPEEELETTVEEEPQEVTEEQNETALESQENVTTTETQNYVENQTITFEEDANLRYLPSLTSRVKATANSESTYTIKEILNNWVKVSNDTNSGWILKSSIEGKTEDDVTDTSTVDNTNTEDNNTTSSTTVSTSATKGKVNVDSARIRKTPNGTVIDSLGKGTEVTILGEEDGWYEIKTSEYDSCYIAKRLITEN